VTVLTAVSVFLAILALTAVVLGVAYLCRLVGSRFFGDDPGGRDPNLGGQFLMWGNGPKYIEFLREKQRLVRKNRRRSR
jgi:hypothetical protein